LCNELLAACLEHHVLIFSDELRNEFERALHGKLGVPGDRARWWGESLSGQAVIVVPLPVPPSECRDRDDCVVLGTALAGNADLIVTGDDDLLVLKSWRGIRIVSPRECFKGFRTGGTGGAGRVGERRARWRKSRRKKASRSKT